MCADCVPMSPQVPRPDWTWLELPGAAAEDGHAGSVARHSGDVDVVAADHEVDVRDASVHARAVLLLHEPRIAVAERDVADGVLVEEGVEERRAEPPDTALAVHERDLAEACGAVVQRGAAGKDFPARVGGDLDGAALREAHDEPFDDRSVEQRERPRRGDDTFGASRIGRREYLLRGEVRHVPDPVHRLTTRGLPPSIRKEP